MTPAIAELILQAALKYGPSVALNIAKLFSVGTFTLAEWEAAFAPADRSYESYVAPKP